MNRFGLAGMALGILAPTAFANDGEKDKEAGPTLLQEEMVNIKFTPGNGVTFDGGDSYSLNMSGGMILRYNYASLDNNIGVTSPVNTFDVRIARLTLSGHIFDRKTRYVLALEGADNMGAPIKDAFVERDVTQLESMKVVASVGQMRTGFGREANGHEFGKALGEFTLAARSFSGQRSRGATLSLVDNNDAWRVSLGLWNRDAAGGSLYSSEDALNTDNELNYSLTFRYDGNGSMGDRDFTTLDLSRGEELRWGVGGGLWFGNSNVGNVSTGNDVEQLYYNLNVAIKTQGIGGIFEYYGGSSEQDITGSQSVDDSGWSLLVNYSLGNGWTFGGQVSSVINDNSNTVGGNTIVGVRPTSPTGTTYAGKGTTTEYGIFASRDFQNLANHRLIMEVIGQKVKQETTPTASDTNMIFRATYVLVF